MKKYYVYMLAYPESMGGAVFYVGKGTGYRVSSHEAETRNGGTSKKHDIIRSIWNAGEQVVKDIVFETDDEQEAFTHESELIKRHASILANIILNPNIGLPSHLNPSTEEYFQKILERAIWLNRGMAERYPEDQRETFLTEANARSERDLRKKQERGWR